MNMKDRIALWIANLLPRRVAYWAANRLACNATTGQYRSQMLADLTLIEAMRRWEKR